MNVPTLYLIDDDIAVRRALESVGNLLRLPVLAFDSAEKFLKMDLSAVVGCAIVDIKLPGISGLELQEALHQRACSLPIIIISGHADVSLAVQAMRSGAVTVLEKPFALDSLTTFVRQAIESDRSRREVNQRQIQASNDLAKLTSREREVLSLIARGQTNKAIAAELHLTVRAIEDRRARMMRRLNVGSLAELLAIVQLAGLSDGVEAMTEASNPRK